MRKKSLLLLLIICMMLGMVGCGEDKATSKFGNIVMLETNVVESGVITDDGRCYIWGDGGIHIEEVTNRGKIKDIAIGFHEYAVVNEDGELYIGYDKEYILDNVKMVDMGRGHGAAITENGDLYTWGHNHYGQLGNGTIADSQDDYYPEPVKIMENVKYVSLGDFSGGAITESGELYVWGQHNGGGEPKKMMYGVAKLSMGGDVGAAITENGDLYTWGYGKFTGIEDYDKSESYVEEPTKIMEKVKYVDLGMQHGGAITENGDLYVWGDNYGGRLGTGDRKSVVKPVKVMEDVINIAFGMRNTMAYTEDGKLYVWGNNTELECGYQGIDESGKVRKLDDQELLPVELYYDGN